jgi:hypothetical protein
MAKKRGKNTLHDLHALTVKVEKNFRSSKHPKKKMALTFLATQQKKIKLLCLTLSKDMDCDGSADFCNL